jgi:hypothetical protein
MLFQVEQMPKMATIFTQITPAKNQQTCRGP